MTGKDSVALAASAPASVTAMRAPRLEPDVPELLSRARAIAEVVRARVQETEANRCIAEDVIEHTRNWHRNAERVVQLMGHRV